MAIITPIGSSKPIQIAFGGTNASSMTNTDGVVYFDGTSLVTTTVGSATQVLTSNGAGVAPTFQAAGGGGITTINGDSGSVTGSTITLTSTGSESLIFTGSGSTMTFSTVDGSSNVVIGGNAGSAAFNSGNTWIGSGAGNSSTGAANNVAIGINSGQGNGFNNSVFIGAGVANTNLSGGNNVFIGTQVAAGNLGSAGNDTVVGYQAYFNALSAGNTIIGYQAGQNVGSLGSLGTLDYNILIGYQAGSSYNANSTKEVSNIVIGATVAGTSGETHALRIGNGTGTGIGQLNKSFIAGIQGITVTGTAVLVSSSDQLGIAVSSKRFKENIKDLKSSNVLQLEPKSFNYNVGDDKSPQTGLIAEEVHKIMPELVVLDQEGIPQSVKYHDLPVLLLLEIKKLRKELDDLKTYTSKALSDNNRRF